MEDYSRSMNTGGDGHRNLITQDKLRIIREDFKKAEIVLKLNKSILFVFFIFSFFFSFFSFLYVFSNKYKVKPNSTKEFYLSTIIFFLIFPKYLQISIVIFI